MTITATEFDRLARRGPYTAARLVVSAAFDRAAPASPSRLRRQSRLVAVAGFLAAVAIALPAARASYRYDESVTVGSFVRADLLAPFTRQVVHNNHPMFSFVEHLVWSMGGHSEAAMRVPPMLFFALTAALVGYWTTRRWGPMAGTVAASVLVAHPLVVDLARQARGYSLVMVTATATTMLAIRLLERPRDGWAGAAYVVLAALGIATHLYAAGALLCQFGLVVSRRRLSWRWLVRWPLAFVLGATAYAAIPPTRMRHEFQPSFPADATWALLGATLPSLIVLGACSGMVLTRHRWDWLIVAAPAAATAGVWGILDARDIYPRFLVWVVPGIAVAAGWAVGRARWSAVPLAVAIVSMLAVSWSVDDSGIRDAGRVVDAARARGATVCTVGAEALQAYTGAGNEFDRATRCDMIVKVGSWIPAGYTDALTRLPHRATFGDVDVATTARYSAALDLGVISATDASGCDFRRLLTEIAPRSTADVTRASRRGPSSTAAASACR